MRRLAVLVMLALCLTGGASAAPTEDIFVQHQRLMYEAITRGDAQRVKMLLKTPYIDPDGFDVKLSRREGSPYLLLALSSRRNLEIFDILVAAGARVSSTEGPPNTSPIHYAVLNHLPDLMDFVLDRAAVEHPKCRGESPRTPRCDAWREFLDIPTNGLNLVAFCFIGGGGEPLTPNFRNWCLKTLLEAGLDPNVRRGQGPNKSIAWYVKTLGSDRDRAVFVERGGILE